MLGDALERFLFLWNAGIKQGAIAAKLGVSPATITRWSKEQKLDDRRKKRNRLPNKIRRLHKLGYSQHAIAEQLEMHQTTILYHLRQMGLAPNGWTGRAKERHQKGFARWRKENGLTDNWHAARIRKAIKNVDSVTTAQRSRS